MIRRDFFKKAVLSIGVLLGLGGLQKVVGNELTYEEGWDKLSSFILGEFGISRDLLIGSNIQMVYLLPKKEY